MIIGTKEHDEMMANFEKNFKEYRLDREKKELWAKGYFYQDGEANKLFYAYMIGYGFARIQYLNN